MKYYINYLTNILLIDTNEYTPYLADRGYTEISKEFYDKKNAEQIEQFELENKGYIEEISKTNETWGAAEDNLLVITKNREDDCSVSDELLEV